MTEMLKRDFLREKLCILDGITCVDDTKFNFEIRSLGIDDHYHAIKIRSFVRIDHKCHVMMYIPPRDPRITKNNPKGKAIGTEGETAKYFMFKYIFKFY